jgi:hypothetical protein
MKSWERETGRLAPPPCSEFRNRAAKGVCAKTWRRQLEIERRILSANCWGQKLKQKFGSSIARDRSFPFVSPINAADYEKVPQFHYREESSAALWRRYWR